MIITSKAYFKELLSHNELDLSDAISNFISNCEVDNDILLKIYNYEEKSNDVIDFYKFLIDKLHKIITELLSDSPKTACQCIKTITSLITQATITLEKHFDADNLEAANEFMDCVGLKELSNSLTEYFSKGDLSEIENQLLRVKNDIIFVKDNFC